MGSGEKTYRINLLTKLNHLNPPGGIGLTCTQSVGISIFHQSGKNHEIVECRAIQFNRIWYFPGGTIAYLGGATAYLVGVGGNNQV